MLHWNAINNRQSNDSTPSTRKETALSHSSNNNNSNDGHHKGAMSGEPEPSQMHSNKIIRYLFRKTTTKTEVSTSPSTGPIQEGVLRYSKLAS